MLNKISAWLYRFSTISFLLISTIVFMLFLVLVMPGQTAKAAVYSGGVGMPDMTVFYSASDLRHMAETYGEQGRQAYIHARFTFDLAFPLVYTFFLAVCTSWMLGRLIPLSSKWRLLNLLPLAAMLFDFLENICAVLVMAAFPASRPLAAQLAVIFTPLKWLLVSTAFLLLIGASLLAGFRSIRERKKN